MCVVAHALVRVGDGVHFDAQFKVGWHYLFMPLLFLFPLRVENSWRSILGRSRLTQTESIASPLNETHACARTFRRCCLSIRLPSWLLFVLKLSFYSAESAVGLTCLSVCVSVMIPGVADGGTSRLWCCGPNGQAGASALGCSD